MKPINNGSVRQVVNCGVQGRKQFHLTAEMTDNIIEKVAFGSETENSSFWQDVCSSGYSTNHCVEVSI